MSVSRARYSPVLYAVGAALGVFLLVVFLILGGEPNKQLWETSLSPEEAKEAYSYAPPPNSSLIRFIPGIERWYVNERVGFSFRLPEGFTAPDGTLKDSGASVVQVSNQIGNMLEIIAVKTSANEDVLSEVAIQEEFGEGSSLQFTKRPLPDGTVGIIYEITRDKEEGRQLGARFLKNEHLFILLTDAESAELLDLVLGTWRFGLAVPPP